MQTDWRSDHLMMQFQLQMLSNNESHRKMIMKVAGGKVSFISQTFIRKLETVNLT